MTWHPSAGRFMHRPDGTCPPSCGCGEQFRVEIPPPLPGEWKTGDEARAGRIVARLEPRMCDEAGHPRCIGEIPEHRRSSQFCSVKCQDRVAKRRHKAELRQMEPNAIIAMAAGDDELIERINSPDGDLEPAAIFGVLTIRAVVDGMRYAA